MRFSKSSVTCFILQSMLMLPNVAQGLSQEDIEKAVENGGANKIDFSSAYYTSGGVPCNGCALCSGSRLNSLFDSDSPSLCVNCDTNGNCDRIKILTSFATSWKMDSVSFSSSDMKADYDPSKIIIEATNDDLGAKATWTKLIELESASLFTSRETLTDSTLVNNEKYHHYALTLVKKAESSKISLGQYGLVQSYLKQNTCSLHERITGNKACAPVTEAPTMMPTTVPTLEPTNPQGFVFTNQNLRSVLNQWYFGNDADKAASEATYGHISGWDVSRVTHMYAMFYKKEHFNEDLSSWNMSSVTNAVLMFSGARKFNSDLSAWDVSRVTDMREMFDEAYVFNSDISGWNVSRVRNFDRTFMDCHALNVDLSDWDISSASNLSMMFDKASAFDQKLCWDVTDKWTDYMFRDSPGSIECD